MKSLFDRGFLFLLSSAQMVESKGAKNSFYFTFFSYFPLVSVEHLLVASGEDSAFKNVSICFLERRGRVEKNLQALFIFQESRMVVKYCKYYSLSSHSFSDNSTI